MSARKIIGIILILALTLMTFVIPLSVGAATYTASVTSPATGSPGYAKTNGNLTVTFSVTTNETSQNADFYLQVLQHGTTTALATQTILNASFTTSPQSFSYPITLTSVAVGTYDLRVGVKDTGSGSDYTYSAIQSNAVIVGANQTSVTLSNPSGGNYVKAGTAYTVQWNVTSTIPLNVTVSAMYSTDGGTTYPNVAFTATSVPTGMGSASWTPPAIDCSTARLQLTVVDAAGNTIVVTSTSNFYVLNTPPTVTLSIPNASTVWNGGTTQSVLFTATSAFGLAVDYKVEYSLDGGSNWTTSTAGTNGWILNQAVTSTITYSWLVPNNWKGTTALVRVTVRDKSTRESTPSTSGGFTINDVTAPTVTISVPAASAHLYNGQPATITWLANDNIAGNLTYNVYLSINGGSTWAIQSVTGGTNAQGQQSVTFTPTVTATATNCKIKVTATDTATTPNIGTGLSATFGIYYSVTGPTVTLTAPNAIGLSWQAGSAQNITWTSTDSSDTTARLNYAISYSADGGGSWVPVANLANQTQGAQTFIWAVADNASTNCFIKVIATNPGSGLSSAAATSAYSFTITAATFPVQTASITLYPGWNLISLPLIPTNTNIQSILGSATSNIQSVWYYSGGPSGTWTSFVPGVASTLTTMTDGKAYLVQLHQTSDVGGPWPSSVTLTFQGRVGPVFPATPPVYGYVAGWNLVGYKSLTNHTVATYVGANVVGSTQIYNVPITTYDHTTGWVSVASGSNMTPGTGYWIYFNTSSTVAPPLD